MAQCFDLCKRNEKCKFVTFHAAAKSQWCFNAEFCNRTNPFDGKLTPAVEASTHTWQKYQAYNENGLSSAPALAGVRELASLSSPWYFSAIPRENASAYAGSWDAAFDANGLAAPFGLRTAEKRNPKYFCDKKRPGRGGGCCNWSGPMWPFETAKAISAAINVLNTYSDVHTMDGQKLWGLLWQYAASHTPLWKVINTTNGEFCDLNDPHSDLKKWLLPGTQNFWIAESGCADTNDMGHPAWTDVPEEG